MAGKKYQETLKKFDKTIFYSPEEAIQLVKDTSFTKFDGTVELAINLGIDPKRSDQVVRGTVVLPHGTGKTPRVIVFAKGDKVKEAEESGAYMVGADDLIAKIKQGWSDFDVAVATPDMMGQLGKELGKILGPRMPNPKAGTVSMDIKRTVKELLAGKIQFKNDKLGNIHVPLGKVSFDKEKLLQNFTTLLDAIIRARPSSAKGSFIKNLVLSSTMGPGIKMDIRKATDLVLGKTA